MDIKDKKYDAFISYRHADLDKFVAETLHKELESFKIPKQFMKDRGTERKNICIFRDRDELPLSSNLADPITEALKNSSFLIVICTPRLLQSQWCKREIETFIQFHGRRHIFTVLAEGEPMDSFPEQLLYETVEEFDSNGNLVVKKKPVEPLAAEVRGKNFSEVKKKIKQEKLRILAPMFDMGYDDLKQRHKEQTMKRALTFSAIAAAVLLTFSTISTIMALEIKKQSNRISEQNEQILLQNDDITKKNEEIVKQSEQIQVQYEEAQRNYSKSLANASSQLLQQGNSLAAAYTARKGMPDTYEHSDKPYTAECEYALADAMYLYQSDDYFLPRYTYDVELAISSYQFSEDGTKLLVIDSSNQNYVWDTSSHELLLKVQGNSVATFCGNNQLIYGTTNEVHAYDFTKQKTFTFKAEANAIIPYPDGSKFMTVYYKTLTCYDAKDNTECFSYDGLSYIFSSNHQCVFSDDGTKIYLLNDNISAQGLLVMDASTGEILYEQSLSFDFGSIYGGKDKLFVVAFKREEDVLFRPYLSCIDLNTYETIWTQTRDELWLNSGQYIQLGEEEYFYLFGTQEMIVLDATTGNELNSSVIENRIVNSYPFNENKHQIVLAENGFMYSYGLADGELSDMSYLITYVDYKMEEFKYKNGRFYIQPQENNQIIEYRKCENENATSLGTLTKKYLNTVNQDGSLCLSTDTVDNAYDITLKDLKTGEIITTIENDDGGAQVFFIGDGLERFAIKNQTITIYSVKDGKEITTIEPEGAYGIAHTSMDHKIVFIEKYQDSFTAYSLETGELLYELPIEDSYDAYVFSSDLSVYARYGHEQEEIRLYHVGDIKPFASKEMKFADARTIFFSEDGKYLCITSSDGRLSFYLAETLELVKTIYDVDMGYPDGVDYNESIQRYLVKVIGGAYLLNQDCDVVASIQNFSSYDEKNDRIIMANSKEAYTIPYYSYDDLIKAADEMLNGYEMPDKLKRQYNVE